ncbi:hypothetical protein TrST_g6907 [Triparma strigata]|uniref:Uncharacterized protein n=1 Tax=Triparma strigata TaxID=1606541 RepID=A0A9W7B8M4_9STRA|nr:hypothetical protein TrST_g6907 [Triparma strigata]
MPTVELVVKNGDAPEDSSGQGIGNLSRKSPDPQTRRRGSIEFVDNPMVGEERRSKLVSLRDINIERPLLQTPEYVSVFWVMFLVLLELGGLGIALMYFILDEFGDKKTIEYLILTIQPFYVVFQCLITSFCSDPIYASHRAFRLLSFFNLQVITAIRFYAFYDSNKGAISPGVLLTLIVWPFIYNYGVKKAFQLPQKLNDADLLNQHNLTVLPMFAVSTLLSMLYMASESFGCLFDEAHYGVNVTNCQDIIDSNETILMFIVLLVYFKMYMIPHMEETYSLADVMRLNFTSARDQLQLLLTALLGLFALFIFSSSTLKWDKVPCTSNATVSPIKYDIYNEGESEIRGTYITVCIVSIAVVSLTGSLGKKRMQWLRDQLKTTIPGRLSPVYCLILDFGCLVGLGLSSFYVKIAYSATDDDDDDSDEILAHKLRLSSKSYLLVLNACALVRLFANPRSLQRRENFRAAYTLVFLALQILGSYLENAEGVLDTNVKFLIFHIPAVLIVLRSRLMLSKSTPQVIDQHLQNIFGLGMQLVPTLFFLYSAPQTCVMYSGYTYPTEMCVLLLKCDFAAGFHLSCGFLFYICFGWKLENVNFSSILSFREIRVHSLLQIISCAVASVTTFLIYGLRESDEYEHNTFIVTDAGGCGANENENLQEVGILKLDKFLITEWPIVIIGTAWLVVFFFQWQHSSRLEIEATFHRRSVDEQQHESRFYRIMDYVDKKTKFILEALAVKDEQQARVSPFFMFIPGALSFAAVFMSISVAVSNPQTLEDIVMDGSSYVFYYLSWCADLSSALMATVYVYGDLENTNITDLVVSFAIVLFFFTDAYISYSIGETIKAISMTFFGCLCFVCMLIAVIMKKRIISLCSGEIRRRHCTNVMLLAMSQLAPILFISAEYAGCLVRNSSEIQRLTADVVIDKEMHLACLNMYWGTNAILFQLMAWTALYAANSIGIEQGKGERLTISVKSVATMKLPSRWVYAQVLIAGWCFMIAIFLYGVRGASYDTLGGTMRKLLETFHYSIFFGWFAIALLQYFVVYGLRSGAGDDVEEAGDRVTNLSIEEKMKSMSKSTKAIFGVDKSLKSKERKRKSTASISRGGTTVAAAGLGLSNAMLFNDGERSESGGEEGNSNSSGGVGLNPGFI